MREIKFRAWDSSMKKMNEIKVLHLPTSERNGHEIELMQYTGLKDKNGKDIYEWDIVACSAGCTHKVIWREAQPFVNMGCWDLEGLNPGSYDWIGIEELKGNVFENPELLK